MRAHLEERSAEDFMKSLFNDAYAKLISDFLYKAYVVGFVEAVQTSTHNICFYKEVDKSTLAVFWRLLNCLTVHL